MDRVNAVIIGGGVVGCAIARELSSTTDDVILLEQMPKLGMMTSTRNSGVLHSGIFYASGTLKARLCLEGNRLTKEFCAAHHVPFKSCGKLVVGDHEDQAGQLEVLAERGRANGVEGLRVIGRDRIQELEPNIASPIALEVPSTGIVNAEELVKTLARFASEQGASILNSARATGLECRKDAIVVTVEHGDPADPSSVTREKFEARCVVNSAGLHADEVSSWVGASTTYKIYPVRGEYAEVNRSKASLVNALVYPLPKSDVRVRDVLSRKVHLTRTTWGTLLIGPTARYVEDKNDYERDRLPLEYFWEGAKSLLPQLELSDLRLAYSGLRPQRVPPGTHSTLDFVIEHHPDDRRVINLVGMESPSLTAAPAIARHVVPMVAEVLS